MKTRAWWAAGAVATGLLVAACGGSDNGGSAKSGGAAKKSGTVTVGIVLDQTGPAGFTGVEGKKGIDLAVEQANSSKTLGGAKLAVDLQDAASDPKQATSLMTNMTKKDYPVLSVGMTSGGALAAAPIAQRAKKPLAVILAGAPGIVETGDHVYRANAPQPTYHHLLATHLKNKGVKTIAQVYDNDVPTNVTLAKQTWPQLAKENGFQITSTDGVAVTATNFGSVVSKIMQAKPQAVLMHLTGAQHVTFATALKRAGYQGIIAGGAGLSAGILKPMGDQANGILFPLDFSAGTSSPSGKQFVDAYKQKYGADPSVYAADAYDAMQLVINSLKQADSFTPQAVQKGMTAVSQSGFDGAAGKVTFQNRDARVPGVLIEWRDGKENIIQP